MQYLIKIFLTSIVIVGISESAKRSSLFAGIIASLPVSSTLAMVWLYLDSRNVEQVADLSTSIFWMVLPSLGFFLAFPFLLRRGVSFPLALFIACIFLLACYAVYVWGLAKVGIKI